MNPDLQSSVLKPQQMTAWPVWEFDEDRELFLTCDVMSRDQVLLAGKSCWSQWFSAMISVNDRVFFGAAVVGAAVDVADQRITAIEVAGPQTNVIVNRNPVHMEQRLLAIRDLEQLVGETIRSLGCRAEVRLSDGKPVEGEFVF